MSELESLFVRIEADLSDFKRGLREAGRETRAFANEANRAFADVGTTLDLSSFRNELAQSERAAVQAAERMNKAFAKVGKVQDQAALKALKKFGGVPGSLVLVSPQGVIEAPAGSEGASGEAGRIGRTATGAIAGAPLLIPLLLLPGINATVLTILGLMTAGAAIGAVAANADDMFGSASIADLNKAIAILQEKLDSRSKSDVMSEEGLRNAIESLTFQRDALLEQQRQAQKSAARTQEFLAAFTELSDCLRQLCARIDALAPAPSGGRSRAGALSGGAGDDLLFGGAGGDGLFGGAGLREFQRQTIEAGGPLDDLSAGFVKLTQAAGGFEAQGGSLVELLVRSNALFGEQSGLLGALGVQVPELGESFSTFLARTSQEAGALNDAVGVLGRGFIDAFEGAIARGESLSGVLKGLALDMAEIALKTAGNAVLESILGGILGGVAGGLGGGLGPGISPTGGDIFGTPFAKGAAFAGDSVMARNIKLFARGGIVDTPEAFAFANGLGIMGEAGPEAILPLARARSGELGVRAMIGRLPEAGGSAPAAAGPTFNIDARGADREGFRELMGLIIKLDGKVNQVARSIPEVSLRAWANHRRRGGFR